LEASLKIYKKTGEKGSTLAKWLARDGQVERALNIEKSDDVYISAVKGMVKGDEFKKAEKYVEKISNEKKRLKGYRILIKNLAQQNKFDVAKNKVNKLKDRKQRSTGYRMIARTMAENGKVSEAFTVSSNVENDTKQLKLKLYIAQRAIDFGLVKVADDYLQELESSNINLNNKRCKWLSRLIKEYVTKSAYRKTETMMDSFEQCSNRFQNTYFNSLINVGEWGKAQEEAKMFQIEKKIGEGNTLNTLFEMLKKDERITKTHVQMFSHLLE
ncbi:MAG: hypothetical protein ABEH43_11685, partial [Flavobacteriales bacterium]